MISIFAPPGYKLQLKRLTYTSERKARLTFRKEICSHDNWFALFSLSQLNLVPRFHGFMLRTDALTNEDHLLHGKYERCGHLSTTGIAPCWGCHIITPEAEIEGAVQERFCVSKMHDYWLLGAVHPNIL